MLTYFIVIYTKIHNFIILRGADRFQIIPVDWRSGKGLASGTGGLGFDYRDDRIGQSVANGSPPLRRFFGSVLPRRYAAE